MSNLKMHKEEFVSWAHFLYCQVVHTLIKLTIFTLYFFLYFILKRTVQQFSLYLTSVASGECCWLIACKHCCSSWRDGHVPNVNKHHAGWPNPAWDPAPLSLHILALCLDCIRGCMLLSAPVLLSFKLHAFLYLSPYFADASWECGSCVWPSVTATYFLWFRRRRERADTRWCFRLPVGGITHQTGQNRSTKKKQSFYRGDSTDNATSQEARPPGLHLLSLFQTPAALHWSLFPNMSSLRPCFCPSSVWSQADPAL